MEEKLSAFEGKTSASSRSFVGMQFGSGVGCDCSIFVFCICGGSFCGIVCPAKSGDSGPFDCSRAGRKNLVVCRRRVHLYITDMAAATIVRGARE